MRIFIHEHGITFTGKAWEIRAKLKEYSKKYQLVAQWLAAMKTER